MLMKPSVSGEITDIEWSILDYLVVTYYSGSDGMVECTAFNSNGSPIGGGYSYPKGGVARVTIDTPEKYVGQRLKVVCK